MKEDEHIIYITFTVPAIAQENTRTVSILAANAFLSSHDCGICKDQCDDNMPEGSPVQMSIRSVLNGLLPVQEWD
jgi:hypothetical protein